MNPATVKNPFSQNSPGLPRLQVLQALVQARHGRQPGQTNSTLQHERPNDGLQIARVQDVYALYRRSKAQHRSRREVDRIFNKYILPSLGLMPISVVDRVTVTRLLDQIAHSPPKYTPAMARAVAAQISAFFSWSIARFPELQHNPCQFADRPPKPRPRTRVLVDLEVLALWEVLGEERFPWSHAIKLILLTGQRRGEVFEADWLEFDLDGEVWTIPASRTKNGLQHRLALSRAAVAILKQLPQSETGKLFPARSNSGNGASGFSKAMRRINESVRKVTGVQETFTLHDLRRTVATGLQRLGVKIEVTEAVLNHVSGTRDGIVGIYQLYQYAPEKKHALEAWANFVETLTGDICAQASWKELPCL